MPKNTSEDDISESNYEPTFEDEITKLKMGNIADFLRDADNALLMYFSEAYPKTAYSKFRKAASKIISTNKVNPHSISQCWNDEGRKPSLLPSKHKEDFFYAFAYTEEARRQIERKFEISAWPLITQAAYYIGLLDGYSELKTEVEKNVKTKSNGGKATSSNRDPLRNEAARLLIKKVTKDGWKTHDEAAEGVQIELEAFAKANNLENLIEDAYESVKRWLADKDNDIRKTHDIVNATCEVLYPKKIDGAQK